MTDHIIWNTDVNAPCCLGEIQSNVDPNTILVQTDWDYPGVASAFGWSTKDVQHPDGQCEHDNTDGTVDCDGCGMTATDFIGAAGEWLSGNDGATAEDPGYFDSICRWPDNQGE